jgi:beta-phosphoglucomutase-like phosphatase (HAD superfamily)
MTASPAPHAIVFDLDGTLVDTVGTRVDAWMAVFPRFGIDPDPEFLAPLMGSDGKYLARLTAEQYGVELEPGQDALIDQLAGSEFRARNADPHALPAAASLLESLTGRGIPWAVATSSLPEDAVASVQALGLPSQPVICDGGDVEHAKPAPDLLKKAAGMLEVDPSQDWNVGDSRWDKLPAKAAGMSAVAVLTAATRESALLEAGADVVHPTLAEFRDTIPAG